MTPRPGSAQQPQEIASGYLFYVRFCIAAVPEFFENQAELRDILHTFRGDCDAVEIGAEADMVRPCNGYDMPTI